MSRVYESGEYYQKVKESTNGLERECVEEEKWQRGEPFAEPFSLRRLPPPTHEYGSLHQPYSSFDRGSHAAQSQRLSPFTRQPRSFRFGDRFGSHSLRHRPPMAYFDDEPVYSITNSESHSRPGSPQVVAGAGDIVNTEHGFTIELDVKHFRPQDIKVTLSGNTLTVVGDRLHDEGAGAQTLRRTFTRKYSIPNDVRLSSISSYMTDMGTLIIRGSRKGWKETEISVHVAPQVTHRTNSSVMSVV